MTASFNEISRWFDRGVAEGATHMVVECDTFDYDDYPVYANSAAEARKRVSDAATKDMTSVMEVYVLDPERKDEQMAAKRAFNYELPPLPEERTVELQRTVTERVVYKLPAGLAEEDLEDYLSNNIVDYESCDITNEEIDWVRWDPKDSGR